MLVLLHSYLFFGDLSRSSLACQRASLSRGLVCRSFDPLVRQFSSPSVTPLLKKRIQLPNRACCIRNFEQSLSSAVTTDAYRISFHKMNSGRRKINCDGKKLCCAPNLFCGESLNRAVRTRNGVMDIIAFRITGKNDAQACHSVVR